MLINMNIVLILTLVIIVFDQKCCCGKSQYQCLHLAIFVLFKIFLSFNTPIPKGLSTCYSNGIKYNELDTENDGVNGSIKCICTDSQTDCTKTKCSEYQTQNEIATQKIITTDSTNHSNEFNANANQMIVNNLNTPEMLPPQNGFERSDNVFLRRFKNGYRRQRPT